MTLHSLSIWKIAYLCALLITISDIRCLGAIPAVRVKNAAGRRDQEWASVVEGYRLAISECQKRFRWDRWNCSLPLQLERGIAPVSLTGVLPTASKEAAFMHALVAAAVTHSLIKACYLGNNDRCPCPRISRPKDDNRQWHMCKQNLEYGFKRGKRVIKNLDIKDVIGVRKHFNKRNAKVGFQAIKKNLPTVCRCHGATGSCTSRTCWKTLPRFEKIGLDLRELYDKAVRVVLHDGAMYKAPKRSKRKIKKMNLLAIRKSSLIFFDDSPNFCKTTLGKGREGTLGRICDPKRLSSCLNLCDACGYRTLTEQQTIVDPKCSCQFQWCCKVVCQPCTRTITVGKCVRK